MKKLVMLAIVILLAATNHQAAKAKTCAADNKTRVTANGECLVIEVFGETAEQTSLVVFIHGDGYRGRPSDYLYPLAERLGAKGVVAVGLIRPGYFDSDNNRSTGNSYRKKGDGYKPHIVKAVAEAIKALKAHYKAGYVVLAGHSGGAAIAGVILGKYPGLVNAAVLGGCPCNVPKWRIKRRGRNNWHSSLSPHDFVGKIDKKTKVVAITGSDDRNTVPEFGKDYVKSLKDNGIDATFIELPNVSHNGVVRTEEYEHAITQFLAGRS